MPLPPLLSRPFSALSPPPSSSLNRPVQAASRSCPRKSARTCTPSTSAGQPPSIDGRLDDEVWTLRRRRRLCPERAGQHGTAARSDGRADRLRRSRALRRRAVLHEGSAAITTGLGRRDNLPPSDLIRLTFDPRHDHQNAYVFETNPSGMLSDYLFYDDTRQSPDYDAVWDVRTAITNEGWFAEYTSRFRRCGSPSPSGERAVWGFNLRRDIYKTGEFDRWVPTPRGAAGFVSRFGHLFFDDRLAPPRRIELLPVTLARVEDTGPRPPGVSCRRPGFAHRSRHGDDAVRDDQSGLRAGRTGSRRSQPLGVRDFLSGEASVLPRRQPPVRAELPAVAAVSFTAHRPQSRPDCAAGNDTLIERPDATTILGAAKLTGRRRAGPTAASSRLRRPSSRSSTRRRPTRTARPC